MVSRFRFALDRRSIHRLGKRLQMRERDATDVSPEHRLRAPAQGLHDVAVGPAGFVELARAGGPEPVLLERDALGLESLPEALGHHVPAARTEGVPVVGEEERLAAGDQFTSFNTGRIAAAVAGRSRRRYSRTASRAVSDIGTMRTPPVPFLLPSLPSMTKWPRTPWPEGAPRREAAWAAPPWRESRGGARRSPRGCEAGCTRRWRCARWCEARRRGTRACPCRWDGA